MSKGTPSNKSKSMAKVIRFINSYPNDWIERAFAGDQHLIDHIRSKWEAPSNRELSSYESIVRIMTSLDGENEKKLMQYIDRTFEKGGEAGASIKSFNDYTDSWFDLVAEKSSELSSDKRLKELIDLTNRPATKQNLIAFRKGVLDVPYSKHALNAITAHIDAILDNEFKDEFRHQFGGTRDDISKVSAASSFFDSFNQASTYEMAKGGSIEKETIDKLKNMKITRHPLASVNKQLEKDARRAAIFIEKISKKGIPLKQINTTDWHSAPIKVIISIPYGREGGGLHKEFRRFSDREVESALNFWKNPKKYWEGGAMEKGGEIKITGGHKDYIGKTGKFIKDYDRESIIVDIDGKKVVVQKGDYEYTGNSSGGSMATGGGVNKISPNVRNRIVEYVLTSFNDNPTEKENRLKLIYEENNIPYSRESVKKVYYGEYKSRGGWRSFDDYTSWIFKDMATGGIVEKIFSPSSDGISWIITG